MAGSTVGTFNVWPHYSKSNIDRANRNPNGSELGKDEFLKILLTQLSNQDPMQPLQDREFIAQMAQFSSVEQLMNMSQQLQLLQQSLGISSGLIGKMISWNAMDELGAVVQKEGIVEAITFKQGKQYANVGQDEIPLDQLLKIWNLE